MVESSVDQDTDVLDEAKVLKHWPDFEASDRAELKQFIDEKVFKKVLLTDLPVETALVDATWVRKFKRTSNKTLKAKSRLCARGFLDPQKEELPTRSTTATRLSQRLVLSIAATHSFSVRSWDVSGAFLKGLTFRRIQEILQKKGISVPDRKVAIIPPPNVWRHLAEFDPQFSVAEGDEGRWALLCEKPSYGLVDAPLAWQLSLFETLEEGGCCQSLLDENMWHKKCPKTGKLQGVLTTHVDDIAVAATDQFLTEQYKFLTERFGKISEERPPFQHCGARYSQTGSTFQIDQQEFVDSMKVMDLKDLGTDMNRLLEPKEVSMFRSVLGGLLWITATRLDLVAETGVLQSRVTKATVQDMHLANAIVKKAKMVQYKGLGITFKHFPTSVPWRLVAVHDASSASKGRAYSQEGIMILLMKDHLNLDPRVHSITGLEVSEEKFGGEAHILFAHGARAKRISYSTSHSETLAAISGLETASLVALRMAELLSPIKKPSLQQLAALQEAGVPFLPVDAMTDCKDLYSLTTGRTALPQDKSQRVYILAHREARLCGRLRWIILVPTQSMVADALTKPMLSRQLLHLLSTGLVIFVNEDGHPLEARRLPPVLDFTEDDLVDGDDKWLNHMMTTNDIKQVQHFTTSRSMTSTSSTPWTPTSSTTWTTSTSFWLMAALCAAQLVRGRAGEAQCPVDEGEEFNAQKALIYMMTAICMAMGMAIFYLWRCLKRMKQLLEEDTMKIVQPLSRADLVNRMLTAENNVLELQLQLNESVKDINILYSSLRRRAEVHPDEPSSSRPRTVDRRPAVQEPEGEQGTAEAEPEIERAFNDGASRSRDTSIDEAEREETAERSPTDHGSLVEVTHDMDELQRRERRMRNRLHIMNVESNNMEVYLYAMVQTYGPDYVVPLSDILELYERHAPSMEPPGEYRTQEQVGYHQLEDGAFHHMLIEHSEEFGDSEHIFASQMGLYGFRNRRIITRENEGLSDHERAERVENLYSHYRLFTGWESAIAH